DAAGVVGARARLARGVGAAVGGGEAADAGAGAVAQLVGPARGAARQVRVRRHAGGADVAGAGLAVDGEIESVVDDQRGAGHADRLLAVARHLVGHGRPVRRVREAAGAAG